MLVSREIEIVYSQHDGGYYIEQSAIRLDGDKRRATFRTSKEIFASRADAERAVLTTQYGDWS